MDHIAGTLPFRRGDEQSNRAFARPLRANPSGSRQGKG